MNLVRIDGELMWVKERAIEQAVEHTVNDFKEIYKISNIEMIVTSGYGMSFADGYELKFISTIYFKNNCTTQYTRIVTVSKNDIYTLNNMVHGVTH